WDDYFSKRRPSPEVVRDLVERLHPKNRPVARPDGPAEASPPIDWQKQVEQHEHVIAVIQAALIHDQSQPWMYDVLAVSLKLAGRPEEEVERAFLSRLDFTIADVDSMIFSAAYLRRLDANDAALRLYRQS